MRVESIKTKEIGSMMTCLRPSINQEVNDVSKTKVTPHTKKYILFRRGEK